MNDCINCVNGLLYKKGENILGFKLYEFTENYKNLARLMEDNPDMTSDDLIEALASIQESSHDKILNTAEFIKKLEDDVQRISSREKELKDIKSKTNKTIESLKSYVLVNMQQMDIKKVERSTRVVSIRNNQPKLHVKDVDKVPKEFVTYETVLSVSKDMLPKKWQKVSTETKVNVDKKGLLKATKQLRDNEDESYNEYAILEENPSLTIK